MDFIIWDISPIVLEIGSFKLHWYGLFFGGSFFLGLMILGKIYTHEKRDTAVLDYLLIYVMVGAVVGSRLMHCFAYEPALYLNDPIKILMVWKGGLASHGGLLGVILALYIFALRYKEPFLWLIARMTIPGTLTAASVRIGNFFNSEIYGLPSDAPWAIVFGRIDMIPRHPVQLYEALAYLVLFTILIAVYRKVAPTFATKILPGIFLTYMFIVRFFLEYTKSQQADYTIGLPFSVGQMLSVPFIIIGILWIVWAFKNRQEVISKGHKNKKKSKNKKGSKGNR